MDWYDHRTMLDELLKDESDRLSTWEIDFLDDLACNLNPLTPRQTRKIEKIWEKIFG